MTSPLRSVRGTQILGAVLAFMIPLSAAAQRLPQNVWPTAQAISLKLDARETGYTGSVSIDLEVEATARDFQFWAQGQTFTRFTLKGVDGAVDTARSTTEEGLVTVTPVVPLTSGKYSLEIEFTNDFNTRAVGLYRMEYEGEGYLFTQFEAIDARRAFPCWDEPIFKIPFQLILEVPQEHVAVSNTPGATTVGEGGWKTVTFAKTKPLPTYLLAIAVGNLESVPIPGLSIPGKIFTVQGQSHLTGLAVEMTPTVLAALEEYFDADYPFEKLDLIAIPEYWPGAMENPGAVTFADGLLLIDPEAASVRQRRTLARVLAHEFAHMWFGDLVTMAWWDDLWLNESFADWMGDKITAQIYPQYKTEFSELRSVQRVLSGDARPSSSPIRAPVDDAGDLLRNVGVAYNKGKTVLAMIEQWLEPEVFRKGVLEYLAAHSYGTAEAKDLWTALSKAAAVDVQTPLAGFLDQPGYPLIQVESSGGGSWRLSQKRFLHHGVEAPDLSWILPLRLKYYDGEQVRTISVLLDQQSMQVDLGENVVWVLPNEQARGYYRWNVSAQAMHLIAATATEFLTARERAAFLGNAAALLDNGTISGAEYLRLLASFADDPEAEVVSSLISGIARIKMALITKDQREPFAAYMRKTLGPALLRFGLEKRDGEADAVGLFRPRLMSYLGDEGRVPEVRQAARRLTDAYLADSSSVDPSLASVGLQLAALDGGEELFEIYRERFEKTQVPIERSRLLAALASFSAAPLQDRALAYVLEGPLRPNELFTIPQTLADSPEERDRVFDWLTENYAEITGRIPPVYKSFMPFLGGGCSEARLEAARIFFAKPENQAQGIAETLERVTDQVNDCVNLRRREGASVAEFFAE